MTEPKNNIRIILTKAAKKSTSLDEDPYDLPKQRDRIESDYDLLPVRQEPVRTFSEDDYDELPVRKQSEKETKQPHFSQNNNTEDDDDYDELPSRSVKEKVLQGFTKLHQKNFMI